MMCILKSLIESFGEKKHTPHPNFGRIPHSFSPHQTPIPLTPNPGVAGFHSPWLKARRRFFFVSCLFSTLHFKFYLHCYYHPLSPNPAYTHSSYSESGCCRLSFSLTLRSTTFLLCILASALPMSSGLATMPRFWMGIRRILCAFQEESLSRSVEVAISRISLSARQNVSHAFW